MKKIQIVIIVAFMLAIPSMAQKSLEVSFDYVKQAGPGSNQWAVWIENAKGEVVRNLYVTSFTAKGRARGNKELVRGYKKRPDCVPTWVKNAKADKLSDKQIDAFTGATPKANGKQTYKWDFKDANGKPVAKGTYKVCVEATLYGKSTILYTGTFASKIKKGNVALKSSLTQKDETHESMISNVKAVLK